MLYDAATRFRIRPLKRRRDGDEVILGDPKKGLYIAISAESEAVLDDLAAGRTVGETEELFQRRFGERPDLQGFLGYLEEKGWIERASHDRAEPFEDDAAGPPAAARLVGRILFAPPALGLYGLSVIAALAVAWLHPASRPTREALLFKAHMSLMGGVMFAILLSTALLHEMGHIAAGWAVGVRPRLGIGHRLWTLVAETDLSELWLLPRRDRYLPILAGPIVDAVLASLLVLFGAALGTPAGSLGFQVLQASVLLLLLRLLWQCFLYLRTDLYYVLTTLTNCRSLMADTERYLLDRLSRILPGVRPRDLSHLSATERRVVVLYAPVWLGGRAFALAVLATVQLPVMAAYFRNIADLLHKGPAIGLYRYADALIVAVFLTALTGGGLYLWIRSWRTFASEAS